LLAFFIKLIRVTRFDHLKNTSDGALVNYIHVSVQNEYLRILKKSSTSEFILIDDLYEATRLNIYADMSAEDLPNTMWPDIRNLLSEHEFITLYLIYEYRYDILDISRIFGSSRQAVNQTKKRALKKLKFWAIGDQ